MTEVRIRELDGMAEFRQAEGLQREVWGRGDTPDPADLMMVIQAEGGLVAGAFLANRLVGYVFGFPTRDPAVQHSHRLAVAPDMRGRGLGADLKWYQRKWCLARGISQVRWTFDPARITNARLNLNRLGGRSSTYLVDYYGEMGGINSGLPSDRLLVDWRLDDPLVEQRFNGEYPVTLPEEMLLVPTLRSGKNRELEDVSDQLGELLELRHKLQDAFLRGYYLFAVMDGNFALVRERKP
ncbi:GNAT family N-acetyltransferase [Rhizobium glycinendophyticum]|uniref:GNAT family N-acetyltransferase n=1 Tax=Rhizobium glycinendophyticum TaxID=2589807 RepID=A0A504TQ78_9HYPH|nr:GNAT family N-acetyltransferase [Rhizobium glycinendophyticum]TPP04269.1 GNAT family N-acetyltransferase [Rhizobium glycinendophyticum]